MNAPDMKPGDAPEADIQRAAIWLAAQSIAELPGPVTRELRERFGLAFPAATKAMAEAKRIKARGGK